MSHPPLSRRGFLGAAAVSAAGFELLTQDQQDQITAESLAEAQKVFGLEFTAAEREQLARSLGRRSRGLQGLRKQFLPNGLAPAAVFAPRLPGFVQRPQPDGITMADRDPGPLPKDDEDIAFAPVTVLSLWIAKGKLTSTRLTNIYLDRIASYADKLECVITVTRDRALAAAKKADEELVAGKRRGPLHGIPYGAKDLFDTAGIRTTFGAAPYRDRVATADAAVIEKLDRAGAVLIAKTTLGALAMGDVWFGGRTRNPFDPERGSSGSSAGSAAGTAAGLFGFSIGTETLGSIVSPCMRCGTTGLRPTFGRVPRTGAMALSWSMDKVGALTRTAEDALLVLAALHGGDPGDPGSVDLPLGYDGGEGVQGLRIGYVPAFFAGRRVSDADRGCLEVVRKIGCELVEIEWPTDPMDSMLRLILNTEAAAAFAELTLSNRDDLLVRQGPGAWPQSFREAWFVTAVDVTQAWRHRRRVCERVGAALAGVDVYLGPSYGGPVLLHTNATGHPSLTLRSGFRGATPTCTTLVGHLYDEGTLVRVGRALEQELGVWDRRPALA